MWELNNTQAKELTIKYLNDFMESNGFVLKKNKNTNIQYIRKNKNGFETLYLSFLDSFPGKEINYMLEKRIDKVEIILDDILKTLEPNRKRGKNDTTFATNYAKVKGIKHNRYMPEMVNELDVKNSCGLLIQFLENIGLLYLDRFDDIKELDKEINGVNYWKDDDLKPFDTRGDFTIKRIIIAKLTNNPLFEDLIKYHLEQIMKGIKKGDYLEQRKEWLKLFENSVEYLRNMI
jgi:hypothetical protein